VTILRAGERFEYDPTFFHGIYASSERGFMDFEAYDIAVNHFALTEWGRIHWYLQHKNELKAKYHIPTSASYHIVFGMLVAGLLMVRNREMVICFVFRHKKTQKKIVLKKMYC
jgi:hypothetical protein